MPRRRHLVAALAHSGFRRLFVVRLAGQFGDGVFQASLAGAVLFNPERQASAADVAAGFAVRPFGAIFFGRLGDLIGRKYTFLVTIMIMGVSTFIVGVLPNYASIGIAAYCGYFSRSRATARSCSGWPGMTSAAVPWTSK